jgi:glutamyl-tRNA synthetase
VQLLNEFRERLVAHEPFEAESLEQLLHAFGEEKGVKIGQSIHALRVAVTGKSTGVGMFEALAILGRQSVEYRMQSAEGATYLWGKKP